MDSSSTFLACAQRYIRFELETRDNDQSKEIGYIKYWAIIFGNKEVTDIQRETVSRARDELLLTIQERLLLTGREGNGHASVNRHMARLKHLFSVLQDWGFKTSNPCTGLKMLTEPKSKIVMLTTAEICLLLAECEKSKNKELLLAVMMILTSGARKSEILTLTHEQIDYEHKCAIITHSKNGDRASLGFNSEVMRMLKEQRRTTGRIFMKTYIDKGFKLAVQRAGLGDMSLHGLRHVFATQLAQSGMSISMLQTALRIKNISYVQKYAHLTPSEVHEKVLNVSQDWRTIND